MHCLFLPTKISGFSRALAQPAKFTPVASKDLSEGLIFSLQLKFKEEQPRENRGKLVHRWDQDAQRRSGGNELGVCGNGEGNFGEQDGGNIGEEVGMEGHLFQLCGSFPAL